MAIGMGGGMDPGALQRKALEEAARQTGEEAAAPAAAPAGEQDALRFQEAMNGQEAPVTQPENAAVPTTPSPAVQGLGDRILQGMQSASETVQAGRSEAADLLGKENVTQADLLRANFAMMESSNLVSAISKTTEKITQSIKNLQQG